MASIDWVGRIAEYLKLGVKEQTERGALLASLGSAVESSISQYLSRSLGAEDFTESYNGTGMEFLYLRHAPILSVAALTVSGAAILVDDPATPVYPPGPCVVDEEMLVLTDGTVFAEGIRNVLVTYTAGYVTVPEAIVQAGIDWAAALFRDRDRIGISSETVGGQSFGITHDIPKRVKEALDPWRRVYVP